MTKTQFYRHYQLFPYSINELFYFDAFCDMYVGFDDERQPETKINRSQEQHKATLQAV